MMTQHVYTNPIQYSQNNSLQSEFAMQAMKALKLSKKSRVLDLGCGSGELSQMMARETFEGCVIGTDISKEMVEHANQKYACQKNLRFMQMDTSKNIFKAQFDVITSFNSMHWVKDQLAALKGISEASHEETQILLLFSHKKSEYHLAIDKVCASSKWQSYFADFVNPRSFFTVEKYEELTKAAGLDIVSLKEKEMIHTYVSLQAFKDFLRASMANIKRIPKHLQDDFLNDYCFEFFKLKPLATLQAIPVNFWCLEIQAKKSELRKELHSLFRAKL